METDNRKNQLSKLSETGVHVLEFNINKMIGLEYQLKVILNSGQKNIGPQEFSTVLPKFISHGSK